MAKPLGTKSRLIREAIQAAPHMSNGDIAALVSGSAEALREKFAVTPQDVSNQKVALRDLEGKPGKKKGPKPKHEGSAAPSEAAGKDGVALHDIRVVKELANRMGNKQFRELVGLLCP